ncbi:MAG: hypothetical protein M3O33_11035 [Cyanobacteriota bacterium]|nr:hypothetical protein [Cyanobacteriota bacterium]
MSRSKIVVIASVLMLVLVTGCNNEEAEEAAAPPAPVAVKKKPKAAASASPGKTVGAAPASPGKPKAKATTANAGKAAAGGNNADVKQTLAKLNGYLPAAVQALQTDDVDTAKLYVKGFSDNWQQKSIQASVKKQSQDSFQKISTGVTQVNNLMKAATPDKAKATAAIQSLSQSVQQYAKGS